MKELAKNRKAFYNFQVLEKIEAGIALIGTEVKSCRAHNISTADSFARIENGEAFLYNVHINEYDHGNRHNHDPIRVRKLLLKKSEIRKLATATLAKGLTLVPLSFYLKKGRVKVTLGLCRGKSKGDKRETVRKREAEREMRKVMKMKS